MKKRILLWGCLIAVILAIFLCVRSERTNITIQMDAKGNLSAIINHNHNVDRIKPFYNAEEAIYYFFFPSYVDEQRVYLGDALDAKENIYVGGEQVYSVLAADNCYQMVFLCSNNLPTLFIDIDEQSMERIHADKENQDAGMLTVYSSLGEREYDGKFDKLSGRGNSTWARNKKSYNLSLHKEAPLCGLDKGKKWVLMSLVFEDTKMNNMIALDFAHELGMKYTSQATWVDLYINGDYRGIYLLLETVTCADGRVEINKNKDSFLIEKEIPERCDEAEQIFSTQRGKTFVLHYPKSASNEEIRSVEERISQIESRVYDGIPDFENQMDMDSFASYYLVDEITNQIDFELSSMYFYQKSANGKLYAGPIWDYDNSFGAYYPDYTASVLEHENMDLEEYKQDYLHWYGLLMQNEQFESYVREKYEICQPYFSELLQSKIDNWAEYIQQAVYMDSVRWRNLESETRYGDFEQDVRYLKFYLGNRLASINERWGVASQVEGIETWDMTHIVKFMQNGELLNSFDVKDGECFTGLPDKCTHSTWVFQGNGQEFTTFAPILSNLQIFCKFDWNGTEACAVINQLKQQEDVRAYWNLLDNELLSYCVWIPENSEVWSLIDEERTDFIRVVDNGWDRSWECRGEESLSTSTTFGELNYGRDDNGKCYLHIQGDDINYTKIDKEQDTDIIFVVINRELGMIEDVQAFSVT